MASRLTQKETTILKDQMRHEEVCIRKYTDYAKRTADSTLRGMFYEFAQDEQNHHQTLNGLLGGSGATTGTTPATTPGTAGQPATSQGQQQAPMGASANTEQFIRDMAEQKLQAGSFGQRGKSKSGGAQQQGVTGSTASWEQQNVSSASQAQPSRSQSESLSSQSQSQRVNQTQQASQSQQSRQQTSGQNQSIQEASRELTPMFRMEAAQEFAGGAGAGGTDSSDLTDMLMTEQFVSGSYDSAIFDSVSPQIRQTLQSIQKDEQKHGQGIRDYMQRKGLGGSQ